MERDRRTQMNDIKLGMTTCIGVVSILMFLIFWRSIPVWQATNPSLSIQAIRGLFTFNLILCVTANAFIVGSLSYLWAIKRYSIILNRINNVCRRIIRTGNNSILSFRKNDRFQFFGVEVNQFVEELMDRRLQDQKSLNDVQIALSQMPPNPTTEDLRKILKFLDS